MSPTQVATSGNDIQQNGTTSTKPANVIEALAAVRRELPGIGKDNEASAQQGGYRYRGIEAITAAAGPLLGKHGVVFVPNVVTWEETPLTINGKPWTDTRMRIEYRVYGPGGVEDFITVGPLCTIGRDNSDKGPNKCTTQAFKQALLQVLCIGDSKDDVDGSTHEADAPAAVPTTYAGADEAKARELGWKTLQDLITAHDEFKGFTSSVNDQARARLAAYKAEHDIHWPMSPDHMDELVEEAARPDIAAEDIAPAQYADGEEPF